MDANSGLVASTITAEEDNKTYVDGVDNKKYRHNKSGDSSSDDDLDYTQEEDDGAAAAAAAEATRDTLADGIVAQLLRPCVDQLDASIQCTRLSQLDLKLQLDSLASELKHLSLLQQHFINTATNFPILSAPSTNNSPTVTTASKSTATQSAKITDTCTLLDTYAQKLGGAQKKIAVVGNILESTQDRLRSLSQRIIREQNKRRTLLEPSSNQGSSNTTSVVGSKQVKPEIQLDQGDTNKERAEELDQELQEELLKLGVSNELEDLSSIKQINHQDK